MASQIINVNSALNYISSQSGLPIDVVRGWFPNEANNRNKALNVRSAFFILSKMCEIAFSLIYTIPSSANVRKACSINTFKQLYSYIMAGKRWNIITQFGDMLYKSKYRALSPMSFNLTLVGGGGGSSGMIHGYSVKNSPHDVYGGGGAKGGDTSVYINNDIIATATGGSGGYNSSKSTYQNYVRANANDGWRGTGDFSGRNGNIISVDINLQIGQNFKVDAGYGGGGGGGTQGYRAEVSAGQLDNYGKQQNGGNSVVVGDSHQHTIYGGNGGGGILVGGKGGSPQGSGCVAGTNSGFATNFGTFARGATYGNSAGNQNGMGRGGLAVDGTDTLGGTGGNSGGCILNSGNITYFNKL